MREILFRGKRVDNGEWVYGFYWNRDELAHYIKVIDENGNLVGDYEVNKETIGEYTGLNDKNSKKIFEGDIHEYNGKRFIAKYGSCFDNDRESNYFGWYFQEINATWCECCDGTENRHINIVGNIYDNLELLGE